MHPEATLSKETQKAHICYFLYNDILIFVFAPTIYTLVTRSDISKYFSYFLF